jgi:hypothetical protein
MSNPHESLLPQPPVPVPIVAMSGGGMVGGGAEHVSLLQQPLVAVNIEPVRGGGGGGKQVGGGVFPTLSLKPLKQVQIAPENPTLLTVDILAAYREKRKAIWSVIPANYEESRANLFHYEIKTKEPVKIFYIYSWDNFLRFLKTISNDQIKKKKYIYIFFSKLDNITLFSLIFKKYLGFVGESSAETYFLYDRTGSKNQIVWDSKHREDKAEKKFLFLEPASISIPYIKEGKEYKLLLSPTGTVPPDVKDYIGLSSKDMSSLFKFEEKDGAYKPKSLFKITPNTFYSVDTPKTAVNGKDYLRRKYLIFTFEETDLEEDTEGREEEIKEEGAESAKEKVETKVEVEAEPKVEPKVEAEPLKPDPYVLKVKDTLSIHIGVNQFAIRKPTLAVQKEWKNGNYSDGEKAFFADIGITDKFIKSAEGVSPKNELQSRKEALLEKRGDLLTRIGINKCFKEPNLLLTYECEKVRDFLQELYELIQIDRANLFRKTFSGIAPALVTLRKKKVGEIIFTRKDILNLLEGIIAKSKKPKVSSIFNIEFLKTISREKGRSGPPPAGLGPVLREGNHTLPTELHGLSALSPYNPGTSKVTNGSNNPFIRFFGNPKARPSSPPDPDPDSPPASPPASP